MNACTNTRNLPVCLSFFSTKGKTQTALRVPACLVQTVSHAQHGSFFLVAHIIFSLTTYYRYYCIVYVSSHLQPNQILYCAWLLAWLVFVPKVYVCATAVLHIWRVRFVMDEYSLSCHCIIVVSFIY